MNIAKITGKVFAGLAGLMLMAGISSCEKEDTIKESDLPAEIKTYINTHFAGHTIMKAETEGSGDRKTYEVRLSGNVKLDFNSSKNIKDIESDVKLPDSVIPAKILLYVQTNYTGLFITDWELDREGQKVELNNGVDLVFSADGDFIRIDQ